MLNIRVISWKGNSYLRKEDVVAYLLELAGSEETDARTRIEEGAARINAMD